MERILIVEDDLTLSAGLCFEMDTAGYSSVPAYSFAKARYLLEHENFSLALPVIILTANDLEQHMLTGFDMDAEDYVTKPFHMRILKKRVEVALSRLGQNTAPQAACWSDGYLIPDFSALTARRGREKPAITPNEYRLLKVLTENPNMILTRQRILDHLWDGTGNFIDDHTLTVTMNRLRAKIEDKSHSYIKTVRGMGYIWTGGRRLWKIISPTTAPG